MIFVLNYGNYLTENTRASLKDAARRWGVRYFEDGGQSPKDKLRVFDIIPDSVERVLVVDADVLIRSDAPSPFDFKGGFVAVKSLHPDFPQIITDTEIHNVTHDMEVIMSKFGHVNYNIDNFINSGFFLVDRKLKPILEEAYRVAHAIEGNYSYDQTPLNYTLAKNRTVVTALDFTWNARALQFLQGRMQHYVYHYAGQPERQKRIQEQNWYANCVLQESAVKADYKFALETRGGIPYVLTLKKYKIGAEIGVQRGLFSERILEGWKGKLYSIDAWQYQPSGYITNVANISQEMHDKNYEETKKRLARFGERSQIIKAFSNEVDLNGLDFVYIDANHSYEAVLADLEYWYPRVREGGMIAGHDFAQGIIAGTEFGVIKALEDFLADKKHILYTTDEKVPSECYPSWVFFKE